MTVIAKIRDMGTLGKDVVGLSERRGLTRVHHERVEHDVAVVGVESRDILRLGVATAMSTAQPRRRMPWL